MSWESTYRYARGLFEDTKDYTDQYAKSSTLKKAWNAAYELPDNYPGRQELLSDIERYAYQWGINLDKISAC